ncbi:MAG: aldo/keto reductase family protein [Planctomycetota bacterium]|nr:aldo/keto reductase family protein [Planctomycetota bacterium]
MHYRNVGSTGLKVSAVSIGGWLTFGAKLDQETTSAILRTAREGGVNFIDLADAYASGGAEKQVGRFLDSERRAEWVISSKLYWPQSDDPNDRGLSRKHIFESCERSLRNLRTDYLDIYFCHREDSETPLEETVRAMDDLVRQGKVLYWGTSVWRPRTLRRAHSIARHRNLHAPVVEQPPYSLLDRSIERRVLPTARRLGMGLVVWSPLAGGILTGKYNSGAPDGSRAAESDWLARELTESNLARVQEFCAIAESLGTEPATLALAWILRRPEVSSVITGATNPQQIASNLQASDLVVPEDVVRQIERIFS